jgi:hypothetical protein
MDLTIIVTTMPERKNLLSRCLWHLENQTRKDFEILVMHGPRKKGDKLNMAFDHVDTSHLMMVDDDDYVALHLVEWVYGRAETEGTDFDFIGYNALQMVDGMFTTVIEQEIASHICPMRTELAKSEVFGNHYLADIEWTKAIAPKVETSSHIDQCLYFYDKWNPPGEMTGWSPPRNVGPWPHDKSLHRWL